MATPKFESIADLSTDDPRFRFIEAWADLNTGLGLEPETLHDAYDVQAQLKAEQEDAHLGDETIYDDLIEASPSDIADALNRFRDVAEEMKGYLFRYKRLIREIGFLSTTRIEHLTGHEKIDDIDIVQQGEWWPGEGRIEKAYATSIPSLGRLSVGVALDTEENDMVYLAMNTIHHICIFTPDETPGSLEKSPAEISAERMRELYRLPEEPSES